jgi:hypothetical protein
MANDQARRKPKERMKIEISEEMIQVVRSALRELTNQQLESIKSGQFDGIDALVFF